MVSNLASEKTDFTFRQMVIFPKVGHLWMEEASSYDYEDPVFLSLIALNDRYCGNNKYAEVTNVYT